GANDWQCRRRVGDANVRDGNSGNNRWYRNTKCCSRIARMLYQHGKHTNWTLDRDQVLSLRVGACGYRDGAPISSNADIDVSDRVIAKVNDTPSNRHRARLSVSDDREAK